MVSKRESWQVTSPAITAVKALGTSCTLSDTPSHRLLSSLVLAGALAAVGLAGAPRPAAATPVPVPLPAHSPAPGTAVLATPILSPSRVPEALQDLQAQQDLGPSLAAALSAKGLGGAQAAEDSCALAYQGGRLLFSDHPELKVMPASNMKLVTATALFDKLGPNYRFFTRAEADGPVAGGVVHGDLYLVGGGDPLLRLHSYATTIVGGDPVYTNVDNLVRELVAAGVRQVTGSVVGDGSRYDSQVYVPSWPARFAAEGDVGELSAIGIDDGGFGLAGDPVPPSAPPAQQSAGELTVLMRKAGIAVSGPPLQGQAPASATTLATLSSPPLSQVLGEVLRESDNTAMELMTKELGLKVSGSGSTAAGTAAVRADLTADGISVAGLVNVDGSGLSPQDRVTCALLVAVLQRAGADGLLVRDLPVAARSGTLANEMQGTPAAGRVRAKTGTLDGVKALSGWVEPVAGQGGGNPELAGPVVFAIVLNGLSLAIDDPAALTDRVAVDLAEYPEVPALARYE